jgi:hypothetical protein
MLYLIRAGDTDFYKVGYTSKAGEARLEAMQTGSPLELHLIHQTSGTLLAERKMHEALSSRAVRGEWFRLDAEWLEIAITMMDILGTPVASQHRGRGERAPRPTKFQIQARKARSKVKRPISWPPMSSATPKTPL